MNEDIEVPTPLFSNAESSTLETEDVVIIKVPHPNDEFRYSSGEDDVINHAGKKFTQQEADAILRIAEVNSVTLVVVKPEGEGEN